MKTLSFRSFAKFHMSQTVTVSLFNRRKAGICTLLVLALLGGCSRAMMPAPNLYTSAIQQPFSHLSQGLKSSQVDVLYVTDRALAEEESETAKYGSGRSYSVAFGSVVVEIGDDLSWEELEAYSRGEGSTGQSHALKVTSINELGRFPATPYRFEVQADGTVQIDPKILEARERADEMARREVLRRLSLTPRKDVFLFIHGVGNSLEDAAATMAEGWHFLGREGVPVIYSWPAGHGGLLFYAYDYESSRFTIFHLKQFLKLLSSMPEVENIHILAHSRGTDVASTALRELIIEARAAGKDLRKQFKIENLVLVAADLDLEIVMQRLVAEAIGPAFGRITIYTSSDDSALTLALSLFNSRYRLGYFDPAELKDLEKQVLTHVPNLDFITYSGALGGTFGHAYFRENPAVASDVILLLRYGAPPGQANGRPLKRLSDNVWQIDDNYLQ
jgi:esterase/lipase superfamily enzyme